ncbi:MAG TPA: S8 family serine peptidase [Fibrobacteria bacterium]|nr:S8 family serine peptidase [Fibrobacteria bacterium]
MTLFPRTALAPILAMALGSWSTSRAASLGRCLGTFTLDAPRAALAKPTAATAYPLPPEGRRQSALASVASDFEARSLEAYGWRLVTLYKGFATLEGDPATLRFLYEAPGILEIHPARPVRPAMEAARQLSRIDGILNWGPKPNPRGVNGKGVLVGLVDFGFDTHHPAFLDTAGRTRFVGIWDPNLPKEKGAPYNLGQVRYQAQLQADSAFGQHETDIHGTHVASCAAGSGSGNPFYGVAPEASLIGVNLSTKNKDADFETNVANGIQWMFHVADSLKMPCVVNLSLSNGHFGPHDGTSLFDRFLDSLAAPGRIVVGAAGNDGDNRLHAVLDLGASDTLGAFSALPAALAMWGEDGKPFKFQALLLDSASGDYTVSSLYYSTATVRTRPVFDTVAWTNPRTGKTVRIAVTLQTERANSGNRRPHAELIVEATEKDSLADLQGLLAGFRMAGPGAVHVWNAAGTPLQSLGIKGFRDGDSAYSISEMGGTAKSVLSVGGYVSKNVFVDYLGASHADLITQKVGELAVWSGRGPTLDGRIKPDLCAPGSALMAALSSAVTHPAGWQLPFIGVWPDPARLTGRYIAAEGTSQAAPIATGTVALMLELDPGLTGAQAKAYLTQTAYRDGFTGALASPSPSWGYGKLDASAAIQKVRPTPVSARDAAPARPAASARFAQGSLEVTGLGGEGPVEGEIVDWRGRTVAGLGAAKGGRMALTGAPLRPGVYIAVLKTARAGYRLRFFKE